MSGGSRGARAARWRLSAGRSARALLLFYVACSSGDDPPPPGGEPAGGVAEVRAAVANTSTRPTTVPPPAPLASAPVGLVPGTGNVEMDGSYTYTIPIEVPPGRAGMEPLLSLVYSSREGDGPLGVGWRLGGQSAITRCDKIPASGGTRGRIQFSNDDAVCLDGQRLILVAGTAGTTTAEYRTEMETFTRVKVISVRFGAPLRWQVEFKDGRVATYGVVHNVEEMELVPERWLLRASGQAAERITYVALAWPLEEVTDRSGNSVKWDSLYKPASPDPGNGLVLPGRIEYTLCKITPCKFTSGNRRVEFGYQDRPAADTIQTFVNGVQITITKRLNNISTFVADGSGAWVKQREYRLEYGQSLGTKRSLLKKVQMCDGAGVCGEKTQFTYGDNLLPFTVTKVSAGGFTYADFLSNSQGMEIAVMDANGDGNDDVLLNKWSQPGTSPPGSTGTKSEYAILSDGSTYFKSAVIAEWSATGCPDGHMATATPVDLDGDGRLEVVNECGRAPAGYRVLGWSEARGTLVERDLPGLNGKAMWTWPGGSNPPAEGMLKFADLNGDGIPEMLEGKTFGNAKWSARRGNSTALTPATLPQVSWATAHDTPLLSMGPASGSQSATMLMGQVMALLDIDGDGHVELTQMDHRTCMRSYTWQGYPTVEMVYRNDFDDILETTRSTAEPPVPTWGEPQFSTFTGHPEGFWYFADVNGDGLKDALIRKDNGASPPTWTLRMNTGAGFRPGTSVGPAAAALEAYGTDLVIHPLAGIVSKGRDNGLRVGDMNGDGRDDIVLLDPPGDGSAGHWSGYRSQTAPARILYSNGSGLDAPVSMPAYPLGALRFSDGWPDNNPRWPMSALADINGDGMLDLVELIGDFTNQRTLIATSRFNPGVDRIKQVMKGNIPQDQLEYDSLSAGSLTRIAHAAQLPGAPPLPPGVTWDTHIVAASSQYPRAIATKGHVVREMRGLIDGQRRTHERFAYRGGYVDVTGRGFLGFNDVLVTDVITGRVAHHIFDLNPVTTGPGSAYRHYPRAGSPVRTVFTAPGSGTSHAADLVDATGKVPTPDKTWTPQFEGHPLRMLSEETIAHADLAGAGTSNVKTTTSYDTWGNAKTVDTIVTDASGGASTHRIYTRKVESTFTNDEAAWRLGEATRVVETLTANANANPKQTTTPSATTVTRTTDFRYNSAGLVDWIIREPTSGVTSSSEHSITRIFRSEGAGLVNGIRTHAPKGVACSSAAACGTGGICAQAVLPSGATQCYDTRRQDFWFDASGAAREAFSNPAGHVTWVLYDPVRTWHYATLEPNGTKTLITRDGFGREREIVSDTGARVTVTHAKQIVRRTVAGGASSAVFYDGTGRPEVMTWSTFGGGSGVQKVAYDSLGNVVSTVYNSSTSPHSDVSMDLARAITALGTGIVTQAAQYDAAGRPTTRQNGAAETSAYAYQTPLGTMTVTDPAGLATTTLTDVAGRVLQVTQTSAANATSVTTHRYGPTGDLESIRNPGGITERFDYDKLGRFTGWRTGTEDAAGTHTARWAVTYNSFGDQVRVAQNDVTIDYIHDALGRVTRRTSGSEVQDYAWDDPANGLGKPRSAKTAVGTPDEHEIQFTYNPLGQLSERREKFAGGTTSLSFGYTYDGFGRLATLRYPEASGSGDVSAATHTQRGGPTVRYNYTNGQVASITDEATGLNLWSATARHVMGMLTGARFSALLTATWGYDPNTLRLASHMASGVTDGPAPSQEFFYYANGTLRERRAPDRVETFQYDGSRRFLRQYRRQNVAGNNLVVDATFSHDTQGLTGVDTTAWNGSTDWSSDLAGGDETYTFPTGTSRRSYQLSTHRIGTTPTRSYAHDASGRVIDVSEGSTVKRHYDWNSFSLPTRVQHFGPDLTRTFGYDAYGARVRKRENATNEVLYVGALYEARNLASPNVPESVYRLVADVGVVAELSHRWGQTTRTSRYRFNDHQGSVAYEVTGSSSIERGFFPFGKRMGTAPTQTFSQLGYTGHRHDDDLGLINMNGRIYDVTTRRFLTRDLVPDQIETTFGTHPYAYVGNNPTNLIDPTGFDSNVYPGGSPTNRDMVRADAQNQNNETDQTCRRGFGRYCSAPVEDKPPAPKEGPKNPGPPTPSPPSDSRGSVTDGPTKKRAPNSDPRRQNFTLAVPGSRGPNEDLARQRQLDIDAREVGRYDWSKAKPGTGVRYQTMVVPSNLAETHPSFHDGIHIGPGAFELSRNQRRSVIGHEELHVDQMVGGRWGRTRLGALVNEAEAYRQQLLDAAGLGLTKEETDRWMWEYNRTLESIEEMVADPRRPELGNRADQYLRRMLIHGDFTLMPVDTEQTPRPEWVPPLKQ